MAYSFDFLNALIEISLPQTDIDVQDLINEIRTAEASEEGIVYPNIANASGKESLGSGVTVGITVNLLNSWQIHFEPGNYVAKVAGGNLVGGPGGDPIAYSAGVQVILIQSAASTIVSTGGSALTQAEHDKLYAVADDVWNEQLSGHQTAGSAGKTLDDVSASNIAQTVWQYATRTLTGFGTLISDIWNNSTRTLTSFGSLQTDVEDALGLGGENTKWSGMAFDANNNIISAVITQYTDNTLTTERKKWQLTASYDSQSRITNYELKEY